MLCCVNLIRRMERVYFTCAPGKRAIETLGKKRATNPLSVVFQPEGILEPVGNTRLTCISAHYCKAAEPALQPPLFTCSCYTSLETQIFRVCDFHVTRNTRLSQSFRSESQRNLNNYEFAIQYGDSSALWCLLAT